MIEVKDLSFAYDSDVLKNVSFTAEPGELIALLGPNGVGKSTLFRCMLGLLRPREGTVTVDGRELRSLSRSQIAREIAYIPQSASPTFNYTVLETVLMGMTSGLAPLRSPQAEHVQKANKTLESLGIAHLSHRGCGRISGGERQLTLLARALVQDARVLIMDEPTANLDYGNSYRVMERVERLAADGYTIIFSTHDPNQAFRHASRVLVIKNGEVLADGRPEQALTEKMLAQMYGIDVCVRRVGTGQGEAIVSIPRGSLDNNMEE